MTSDGTYTYISDNVGNTIEKTKGSGQDTWYYSYDNANELTSVAELSNGVTTTLLITYSYDVQGNLVQQQKWTSGTGTVTTRFAYDGANVWADLDGSNNLLVRYVFGDAPDQIETRTVASGPNAGVAVYFTDMLGSVRDLANASGVVQDHLDYEGYGNPTEVNAAYGDRFEYTGRWYDGNTGLEYDRGRWYVPATGQWMSQDPIGFGAGDPNLYRYVGNDPTNETDPSGLQARGIVTLPVFPSPGGPNVNILLEAANAYALKLPKKTTVIDISTKVIDQLKKGKGSSGKKNLKLTSKDGKVMYTDEGQGPCAEYAKDMTDALKAKGIDFKLHMYDVIGPNRDTKPTIVYTSPGGKKQNVFINANGHVIVEVRVMFGGETQTLFFDAGTGVNNGSAKGKGNLGDSNTGVIAPENMNPTDITTGKPILGEIKK